MTIAKETYKDYNPAEQEHGVLPLVENCRVLEIGFGSGTLLKKLKKKGNDVYATDVGESIVQKAKDDGFENVFLIDASEQNMPFEDNFFDAIYCYGVFGHLTNPHRLFTEIRRVLKPQHDLYFSVPTQEETMGYGPGRHSFVYPGLLERKNLERFIMQMYFRIEHYEENSQDMISHRNYILKNFMHIHLPDILEVAAGDYSVIKLYGQVLTSNQVKKEVEREIAPYIEVLKNAAQQRNWEMFEENLNAFFPLYTDYYPLYLTIAEILLNNENNPGAKFVLESALKIPGLPESMIKSLHGFIDQIEA